MAIAAQLWHSPIANQAKKTCEQLCKQQHHAIRNGALTEEQERTFDLQIVHATLGAVFDNVTIQHISTFASRMGLYQLDQGTLVFKLGLTPEDVINLMKQRVSAVCISYKHTRRSNDGLPQDIVRVRKAVTEASRQLSQNRLLFWCDVIGHTPRGVSWAKQGIDPYLCMPTLRIVSGELREETHDSFWMNIEHVCAQCRGGLFSYDEDKATLRFRPHHEGYFIHVPNLSLPFKLAKIFASKLMCNPILYYRRARCEDDKLEVMKYAVSSLTFGQMMNLYQVQQNETRLLKIVPGKDIADLLALVSVGKKVIAMTRYLDRPRGEIIIEDGERWHGLQESFPAAKILDPQTLEELNRHFREGAFCIRRMSPAVDNITDVISAPLVRLAWCSAMRLRINAFEEHEDHVSGRVVSFRVATEEEELSLTYETSIRKRICFH